MLCRRVGTVSSLDWFLSVCATVPEGSISSSRESGSRRPLRGRQVRIPHTTSCAAWHRVLPGASYARCSNFSCGLFSISCCFVNIKDKNKLKTYGGSVFSNFLSFGSDIVFHMTGTEIPKRNLLNASAFQLQLEPACSRSHQQSACPSQ